MARRGYLMIETNRRITLVGILVLVTGIILLSTLLTYHTHAQIFKRILPKSIPTKSIPPKSIPPASIPTTSIPTINPMSQLNYSIVGIQKQLHELTKVLNKQMKWREFLEERRKLSEALPFKVSSDTVRKQENPNLLIDSVKIDCNTFSQLIILVSSNAPNFKRRNLIRNSWGNHTMWRTKDHWKVIFVLGGTKDKETLKKIHQESEQYYDIIMEDVAESFYKLSHKVMIGLRWVYTSFKFNFILKCDDDVFVQIDRLTNKLSDTYKNEHYIGNVMKGQPIMREGRYKLTKEEHPADRFDPYCSGGGFLLSYHAIGKMIPLFDWESPLKIDDAYIGKLVFKSGIKALHVSPGFYMWNNWCEYTKHLLISHPVKKPECMKFLMDHSLIDNGKLINDTIKYKTELFKPASS